VRLARGSDQGLLLELPGGLLPGDDGGPLPGELESMEFDVAMTVRVSLGEASGEVFGLCRFCGGGLRRARALREAVAEIPPRRRLVLSSGNLLSPNAVSPASLALALKQAQEAGFDAIAPASGELEQGIATLADQAREHRLPFVAANLKWSDGPSKGKPIFPRYRIFRREGRSLVVVGLVPESLGQRLYRGRLGPADIGKGSDAVRDALRDAQAELGAPPDAAIVLTAARVPELRDLDELEGVDLVVSQPTPFTEARELVDTVETPTQPWRRAPIMIARSHPLGLGRMEIVFADGGGIVRVENRLRAVTDEAPVDAAARAQVTRESVRVAGEDATVVLPPAAEVVRGHPALEAVASPDGSYPSWVRAFWHSLAAHAVRDALHVEAAAVRAFPVSCGVGSSVSVFMARFCPQVRDRAVIVTLKGSQLAELGRVVPGEPGDELVFARFDKARGVVDGRPLAPAERYRVALPDALLTHPAYAPVLRGAEPAEGPAIRELLVQELVRLRDRSGGPGPALDERLREWLTPAGPPQSPQWRLAAEQLALSYVRNLATDTGRFVGVREQRLQLPDFGQLSLRGQVSATWDSAPLSWRTAVGARYSRVYFPTLDEALPLAQRELDDALLPETEVRLKVARLSVGAAAWDLVPLVRAAYETEFSPVEQGTRAGGDLVVLPRRSYLSGMAGLGLFPGGPLDELKLGALVQHDFAKAAGVATQFGVGSSMKLSRSAGPLAAGFEASLTWFPPAGETEPQDRDVVGLQAQARLTLAVPVGDWLRFGLTADWLGFRGKVPSTEALGQSFQTGAMLQADRLWKVGF